MAISLHSDLIVSLTELYTTLHLLAAIPEHGLRLPDAESELHPSKSINSEAARQAGYDEDSISVMYALPYLDVGTHEWTIELLPSTFTTTYLGPDLDEGDFDSQREMLHDEAMPTTALRLTWSETGHGIVFIYDTKTSNNNNLKLYIDIHLLANTLATGLITPWKPIETPDEVDDYFHVPAKPPHEVLGPIIGSYRSLHYLGTPVGIDHNHALFSESGGQPPNDWSEVDRRRWKGQYDVWAAVRELKNIYTECGWDVDASEQTHFRRDEFLEKRSAYWEEIVEPLRRIDQEIE